MDIARVPENNCAHQSLHSFNIYNMVKLSIKHTRTRLASQHSYQVNHRENIKNRMFMFYCHSFTKSTYTKNTVPGSALLMSVKRTTAAAKIEAWHIICVSHTLCVSFSLSLYVTFFFMNERQNRTRVSKTRRRQNKN